MRLGGAARNLVVIKIGGSLCADPRLRLWLDAIGKIASTLIIVPGGGPFADAVRRAQPAMGFSDKAAHVMAMLGMDQNAHAFCDLNKRFSICHSADDFEEAWVRRLIPVWAPSQLAGNHDEVAQTWDMTSDSLAAWLAGEMGARLITLVKSAAPTQDEVNAEDLSASRVVDPLFPMYLARSGAKAIWLGPDDWPGMQNALAHDEQGQPGLGARIVNAPVEHITFGNPRAG